MLAFQFSVVSLKQYFTSAQNLYGFRNMNMLSQKVKGVKVIELPECRRWRGEWKRVKICRVSWINMALLFPLLPPVLVAGRFLVWYWIDCMQGGAAHARLFSLLIRSPGEFDSWKKCKQNSWHCLFECVKKKQFSSCFPGQELCIVSWDCYRTSMLFDFPFS